MDKLLTEKDFERAAKELNCSVAAIKAVCKVEAPRGGFNPDGSPVTLFEGHHFHRLTNGKFSKTHPSVSYPTWDRKKYGKNWQEEKARLELAITLDRDAALKSASWGKFQIMGFNFILCGFPRLQDFINAMFESEGAQLDAFVGFVKSNKLQDELREGRWADFARVFNGPRYKENAYDTKLAAAFESYSRSA